MKPVKHFLLLGSVFISLVAYSQKNYLPGKIITLQNDTLSGHIDYRNWEKNPKVISFKKENSSEEITYKPLEISGFEVSHERYLGAIVDSEISPTYVGLLENGSTPNIIKDTVFIQVLTEGAKSLYYNKNTVGNDNFYIRENSTLELLVYKKYLAGEEGKSLITENKRYVGRLILYLDNCSSIKTKIENSPYTEKSLVKLFNTYYECVGVESSYQKKQERIKINIGALAGLSLNAVNFKGKSHTQVVNAEYNTTTNFTAGLFFDIILPRNRGKWSINNELCFASYNFTGKHEEPENPYLYSKSSITIGYSYLKLTNMARYRIFSKNNKAAFINFGMANGYAIKENNNQRITTTFFHDAETTTKTPAIGEVRKYEQGYIFGLGLTQNKFTGEIRYERANGMSNYISLSSIRNSFYLMVGYTLR
ncbi:MAG: hypothetical protein KF845_07325 [Cyclobacteriaceae bacterium]|nr:hypothetical protein [Cyclobacteriaceae bacterium]